VKEASFFWLWFLLPLCEELVYRCPFSKALGAKSLSRARRGLSRLLLTNLILIITKLSTVSFLLNVFQNSFTSARKADCLNCIIKIKIKMKDIP